MRTHLFIAASRVAAGHRPLAAQNTAVPSEIARGLFLRSRSAAYSAARSRGKAGKCDSTKNSSSSWGHWRRRKLALHFAQIGAGKRIRRRRSLGHEHASYRPSHWPRIRGSLCRGVARGLRTQEAALLASRRPGDPQVLVGLSRGDDGNPLQERDRQHSHARPRRCTSYANCAEHRCSSRNVAVSASHACRGPYNRRPVRISQTKAGSTT